MDALGALALLMAPGDAVHLRDKSPVAGWPLALVEPGAGAVF